MQIRYAENKMRNRRSVSHAFNLDIPVNCFHAHSAFKVAGFYAEGVVSEFPEIEAYTNHYGQLGMNAGEIPGNYRVKSPDNG
jgi:hypothetical protein